MATRHVKSIKSADRVLEILELFNEKKAPLSVMDVARTLDLPQSSTSELLGSLLRRGYLARERGERIFRPTSRVALLGAWVHPTLFRNGSLLTMMDRLNESTNLGVALCSKVGIGLKHSHTVGRLPDELGDNAERHLLHSPFGHAIMSMMFSQEVRLLVQRLNAESEPQDYVQYQDLWDNLLEVSKRGFAIGPVLPGWSAIAVLLPRSKDEEQLAVGIIGRTAEIEARKEELLRSLRQALSNHIGPRVASDNFVPAPLIRQNAMMA
jgi:DNA-binding IclR family transcriptional regulator